MNLGQIKQRVRMLGRNYFGTDADRDPFGLDYIIKESANQIARNTDCLVGRRYLSLVAGQTIYATPDIYKIRATRFLDSNGDYVQPRMYNYGDQMLVALANKPAQAWAEAVGIRGMNEIAIYPTPSVAVTNGVMVEGYAIPGEYWAYDSSGNPIVNTDATECPLPVVAHDCLIYGVLADRAMQMMDPNGMQIFKAQYMDRLGQVESYAAMYMRRTV